MKTISSCSAVIMIDPVDGEDPFGKITNEYVIQGCNSSGRSCTPVPFVTPALHVETGLDAVSKFGFGPACAPAFMSNDRFYDSWRGPIIQVNATKFGHLDCCDDGKASWYKLACASCGHGGGIAGTCKASQRQAYRASVGAAVGTFMEAVFRPRQGQPSNKTPAELLSQLTSPSNFPFETVLRHDWHGINPGDVAAGCKWVGE